MMSEDLKTITMTEWRELGFYYDRNDSMKEWIFIGSRDGLKKLVRIIKEYSNDKSKKSTSEHEHYGPYDYLKIMTWDSNGVDDRCIYGTLSSLNKLAQLILAKLKDHNKDSFYIGDDYSCCSTYGMKFIVKEDDFDPASMDLELWK